MINIHFRALRIVCAAVLAELADRVHKLESRVSLPLERERVMA
jgi:hypothetical protein